MTLSRKLLICALIALVPALFIGSVALDHNPQGEFADATNGTYTSQLYWLVGLYWALIGLPLMGVVGLFHLANRGGE